MAEKKKIIVTILEAKPIYQKLNFIEKQIKARKVIKMNIGKGSNIHYLGRGDF